MNNCIFCKIIKKEIPAKVIWENEEFIAFLDLFPKVKGHTLVIPKQHIDYVLDLNEETYSKLFLHSKHLAQKLHEVFKPKKVTIEVIGLEVAHVHVKLIPINSENDLKKEGERVSEEELDEVLSLIKG